MQSLIPLLAAGLGCSYWLKIGHRIWICSWLCVVMRWPCVLKGIFSTSHHFCRPHPTTNLPEVFKKLFGPLSTQTLSHMDPEINMIVFVLEVRWRKEYQPATQVVRGRGMCSHVEVFHLVGHVFNGTRHCVTKWGAEQTGDVSYRSNESSLAFVTGQGCMWLPKVTKLVQSKSGNLYLA